MKYLPFLLALLSPSASLMLVFSNSTASGAGRPNVLFIAGENLNRL